MILYSTFHVTKVNFTCLRLFLRCISCATYWIYVWSMNHRTYRWNLPRTTMFSQLGWRRGGGGSKLSLQIKVEKTLWTFDVIPYLNISRFCFIISAHRVKVKVVGGVLYTFDLQEVRLFSNSNSYSCVKLQAWTFQWDLTLQLLTWTVLHINKSLHQWFDFIHPCEKALHTLYS